MGIVLGGSSIIRGLDIRDMWANYSSKDLAETLSYAAFHAGAAPS